MVGIDGLPAGNTGDDGLPAAAEAGQEVIDHASGEDELVAGHGIAVQPHRRAPAGGAHIGEVFLIVALVVNEPDAAVEVLSHQGDVLLLGLPPVGTGGAEDEDVLVGDAGPVEPLHQDGQVGAGLLPAPGHVRDEDAHLVTGLHGLLNGAGADGMVQGVLDVLPHRPLGEIHRIGMELRHNLAGVQMHGECGVAVFHGFHFVFAFCLWGLRQKTPVSIYDGSTLHQESQEVLPLRRKAKKRCPK